MKRALAVLVLLALTAAGTYLWIDRRVESFATTPFGAGEPRTVILPKGTNAVAVGKLLARAGAIANAGDWRWMLRWRRLHPRLEAGEYEFAGPLAPLQVMDKLVRGEVKQHHFTVAEGLRCDEIMPLVAASDLGLDLAKLTAMCTDRALARRLGTPGGRLEGYLFPDTYSFPRGVAEEQVVAKMVSRAREEYAKANGHRAPGIALTEHQIFTLASIIEKETGVPQERPHISCLFHNRLKKGMRLQTDPTVLYGMYALTGRFDRDLAFHHFPEARGTPNPYNTYLLPGLPAGPIANPGAAALRAAVEPARCNDLYFVARGDGTHSFCPDAKCHAANVARYVAALRRR